MKIKVKQENFALALSHVNKAINTRPNIPVLANVLLETEGGSLKLSSTNLEIGVVAKIGAEIIDEGKITVSARLLSEFVSSLKPGNISIELNDQTLNVSSVDNHAVFYVISAEDFPAVPQADGNALLKINAIEFSKAVDKVAFAAATENSRPVLTGILTKITKRTLTLVGVDGFRLSQKVIKLSNGPDEDFREIIPAKTLQEISKVIRDVSEAEDNVEIYSIPKNNQVIFKVNEVQIISRLIEGEFPNYEEIIPTDKQYGFDVLKQDFINGIKVVSIFARNVVGNKTRFSIDPDNNSLELSAVVVDVGNNETSIDIAKPIGEKLETSYNAKFLQEMLNAFEGDEIVYETNGPTSPGAFREKTDKNFLHIVMPMRIE